MARKQFGREAWQRACEIVATPDGLPVVSTSGMWTAAKLFFLCNYLEQTMRAMHGHPKFPGGMTFVDLFAGAGVCEVRDENDTVRRYPGSSVIAASIAPKSFSRLFLIDSAATSLHAVEARVRRSDFAGEVRAWHGDVNGLADEIASALPPRALNIAFIDPYSLDIHYSTIEKLARARPLDLVILFSDRIDLGRNVSTHYYQTRPSKLDLFLGESSGWRIRYDALSDRSGPKLRQLFADIYCEQLAQLGYPHSRTWPLAGPSGPIFRLVYASKNPLGLKFCDIALHEDLGGERSLFGV